MTPKGPDQQSYDAKLGNIHSPRAEALEESCLQVSQASGQPATDTVFPRYRSTPVLAAPMTNYPSPDQSECTHVHTHPAGRPRSLAVLASPTFPSAEAPSTCRTWLNPKVKPWQTTQQVEGGLSASHSLDVTAMDIALEHLQLPDA